MEIDKKNFLDLPQPPDFLSSLRTFRSQRLYCDVRLWVSTETPRCLFAHRVVLAASSPFFCANLNNLSEGIQDIYLPVDLKPDVVTFLVSWMYDEIGQVEKWPDNLDALRCGAEAFGIHSLIDYLEEKALSIRHSRKKFCQESDNNKLQIYSNPEPNKERLDYNGCKNIESNESENFDLINCDDDESDNLDNVESDSLIDDSIVGQTNKNDVKKDNYVVSGSLSKAGYEDNNLNTETVTFNSNVKEKCVKNIATPRKLRNNPKDDSSNQISSGEISHKDLTKKKFKDPVKHSMIPCEKCGFQIARRLWENHLKFCNVKNNVKNNRKRPCKDPVLGTAIVGNCFKCPSCQEVFIKKPIEKTRTFNIKCARHLYHLHRVLCPNTLFVCTIESCNKIRTTKQDLENHIKSVHENNPSYWTLCYICGSKLKKESLKAHIKLMHTDHQSCKKCDQDHKGSCEKFSCSQCKDFTTRLKDTYIGHCYRLHGILVDGARLHRCPDCDFKSPLLQHVSKHIKSCHSSTEVKCTECDKTFLGSARMKSHRLRFHINVVNKCSTCHKVFRTPNGLRYHLWKIHRTGRFGVKDEDFTILKPYKCGHCDHTTTHPAHIGKHLKDKHAEMPKKWVDLRKEKEPSLCDDLNLTI